MACCLASPHAGVLVTREGRCAPLQAGRTSGHSRGVTSAGGQVSAGVLVSEWVGWLRRAGGLATAHLRTVLRGKWGSEVPAATPDPSSQGSSCDPYPALAHSVPEGATLFPHRENETSKPRPCQVEVKML